MPDQETFKLSSKAQSELGMIPGTQFYSPFPFSGMNVQSSGIAIDDKEFRYVENFFRLGDGKLRAGWDAGPALYTAPSGKTIISAASYNIGTVNYFVVFLSDGTAVQVNAINGVTTQIGPPTSPFYVSASGFIPATSQWGTLYLLISNKNTENDYWIWDGTLLYQAGSLAPGLVTILATGTDYTSVPTVTTYGGNGSGATYDVTINDGGVIQIQITNPGSGYEVGDISQLAFSGGGSDSSAILRAFLANGGVTAVDVTAPGSGYTSATVAFTGGGGSGAAGTPIIGSGVASIAVTNGGTGYTGAVVAFSGGGGSGATAVASIVGGIIVSITVTASGTGYTSTPTVIITGDGSSAAATATTQGGIITGVTITNPGSGYTSAPTVAFSGTGTGATGVSIITSSGVTGVTVVNGGSGFVFAPSITFEGGGGSGATGAVILNGTSIAHINVINPGANYQTNPNIGIVGGGGTGATAVPIMANGQVVGVTVTNGGSGYTSNPVIIFGARDSTGAGASAVAVLNPTSIASVQMSDFGRGYTDAPAVVITPGANNAAYTAPLSLMPFGVSGSAMETFQSRVWIVDPAPDQFNDIPQGGNFQVSAPGSLTDFATSDGGLLFTSTDSFLQVRYVGIRQSNGYLYLLADGSVSVISNVQTVGSPSTTTFNYQNVDPQIGMSWRDSRQDFSRTILFGNETGVYGLYGGAVTEISAKMRDVFVNAIFPPTLGALTPTSATMTVFDVKHFFMLLTILDPDTNQFRNVMVTWNEKEWTISSQTVALTYILTQKIASKLYTWGTDGSKLYPLFNKASTTLPKRIDTKLYGANSAFMVKNFLDFYIQSQDLSSPSAGVTFTIDLSIGGIQSQSQATPSVPSTSLTGANLLQPPNFGAGTDTKNFPCFGVGTGGVPFLTMGLQMRTTSQDFILGNIMIAYHNLAVNQ